MQNLKRMSGVIALLVAMGLWAVAPAQAADMGTGTSMSTMDKSHTSKKQKKKKAKKKKKVAAPVS
ncbi:MAG: hypothetical protein H7836_13910 [Magnetococcus sp. YQC-3]